jgi:hypothetical protein
LSNALVYYCECVFFCFVLLFYLVNVISMCLVLSNVYCLIFLTNPMLLCNHMEENKPN